MSLRFLADENLKRPIVLAVKQQEPALDIISVQEAGLKKRPDREILAFAAEEGRILLSHDYRTMPEHFRHFSAEHSSAGVFLIPQKLPVAHAAEILILIWAASEAEEWANRLTYLP